MRSIVFRTAAVLLAMCTAAAGPIHDAAEQGDLERVKTLLQSDPQLLESPADNEKTPLHKAAYAGHIEVVKHLLQVGARVDARTGSNSTPMHGAAYYGHDEIVGLLLEHGAPLDAANEYGYVPLLSACAGGHKAVVQRLVAAGADLTAKTSGGSDALLNAAVSGNAEIFDLLVSSGADMKTADNDGENLLHYASYGGNTELVRRTIESGLDVNGVSSIGTTPLHNAAIACRKDVIEFLIEQEADVNAVDNQGENCLHKVVQSAFHEENPDLLEVVELLLRHGPDINKQNADGQTPLLRATWSDNVELARKLIESGANLDRADNGGTSPLTASVLWGKNNMMGLLVEHGAQADLPRDLDGLTPLHLAAVGGDREVVEKLLANVQNPNVKDHSGMTPIQYAARYGHAQVAKLLLAEGAQASGAEPNYGWSPLLAKPLGNKEAYLWYLGHCGWAVKTRNHLLIFDYWSRGINPTEPCLSNGHVVPEELAGQNVEVFVTHEHRDHYDSVIFAWEDQLDDLTYIFGFDPNNLSEADRMGYRGQDYEYLGPRTHKTMDGMTIHTLAANDAGVGYLVEVDGLRIYHAGDHAGWREGKRGGFESEIDYLAGIVDRVDFAFVNVTGCHVRDTIALEESIVYTLEKLSPTIFVPTHGLHREHVYRQFADKVAARGFSVKPLCPRFRGDQYHFRGERIL